MMPSNSATARNDQKAALAGVLYEKKTDAQLGIDIKYLLDKLEDANDVNEYDKAIVRDAWRVYTVQKNKTKSMAMRIAELEGKGYAAWVSARSNNDWDSFRPVLQEMVELKKEVAQATKPHLSSYDAQIDDYERGMKSARIDEVFQFLKQDLQPLVSDILKSDALANYSPPYALRGGDMWDVDKQRELCREIAEAIGFDFTKGRFDVSVHPFTGARKYDRILR